MGNENTKQTKKGKGGVKGVLVSILLVAIAIVYMLFRTGLLKGLGLGQNGDTRTAPETNASDVQTEATSAPQTDSEAQTTTTEKAEALTLTVEVTVHGSDYLYQNRSYDLDSLLAELEKTEGTFTVALHDDGASLNAYDALTKALTEKGISYTEETGAADPD